MAATSNRKSTSGLSTGANLQATVELIADIPARMRTLEVTYGLKGLLDWAMESTHQVGNTNAIWSVSITHADGREVAIKSGPNPATCVNFVFREAARILKAEYGPQTLTPATSRRTA